MSQEKQEDKEVLEPEEKDGALDEAVSENGQESKEEVMEEQSEEVQADEAEDAKTEKDDTAGHPSEEKKEKKASSMEQKLAELEEARMRQLAEFENFRKRSEKEKAQMFEIGAKSVIEKILPVLDNFERGFAGVTEEEKESPFVEGMEMVYKQMLTAFEEMDVKPIEAVGKPFDPNFHNAVMTVEDEEAESGTVAEELQKGYLYHDSVVRHSMVKVVS